MKNFDCIVIGGGHAGCEAAYSSAKIGVNTLLITSSIKNIAMTPCNPSIGGPAKGIVVREIDALGGLMGIVADKSQLQIKMLNLSKGPAVHSLRAQVDKVTYPINMQEILLNTKNLTILETTVDSILFTDDNKKCSGVILQDGKTILAKKVIITAGTYMDSYIINGKQKTSSGPDNLPTTKTLSDSLKKVGIDLFRLKTGTPARVNVNTIDFSKAMVTPGDKTHLQFSFYHESNYNIEDQIDCHLIYTGSNTHEIIQKNLEKSAMYSGVIKGVGPRYCPSIEDKIVRFADKDRHQLFLEPESKHLDTIYAQGFSTSMPYEIQDEMIKSLPGLENAKIEKYGYAIEYEAIRPEQLLMTLECKKIKNLYFAGQINGTSGYEEAAGQGIVAGINAALSVLKKEPLILSRMDSYIGLMIDDLITKGTDEPYRLLTSRSEYRLYLRSDNADMRLSEYGYQVGLLDEKFYNKFKEKKSNVEKIVTKLKETVVGSKQLTEELAKKIQTEPLMHGVDAATLLKRPNMDYKKLSEIISLDYKKEELKQAEIQIKYEGYIQKVLTQIKRADKLYKVKLDININYLEIDNLALEAREKLNKIKPETLGHATQISGINPADISVLQIYLEQKRRNDNE